MRIHHGIDYLETGVASERREREASVNSEACSFKRLRFGWLVFKVSTGQMIGVVKTQEHARYVASVVSQGRVPK